MPVGACTARVSSSSSSNQIAMAASAALCHVCRFEKPSSNSPMTLAASSATTPTPSAIASGSAPLSRSRLAAAR